MHRVELVYDRDCPNVPGARAAIVRAFCDVGLTPRWSEWVRTATESPERVRAFASPTVLVDGADVAGEGPRAIAGACRLYLGADGRPTGIPPTEIIAAALRRVIRSDAPRAGRRPRPTVFAAAFAPLALLLPLGACPACWPGYTSVLSWVGIGFLLYEPYLLPLALALATVTLMGLLLDARSRNGYGPLLLGITTSALGLAGRFRLDSTALSVAGSGGLVAAALWSALPRRARTGVACGCNDRGSRGRAGNHHHATQPARGQ